MLLNVKPFKFLAPLMLALVALSILACSADEPSTSPAKSNPGASLQIPDNAATAVFAGGCFWCMEPPFDALPGVYSTISGYAGGTTNKPNYKQVTAGGTGHYESVQVTYDPDVVSYEKLLEVFWRNVDPLDAGGQFCDRGNSYRTAVFFGNTDEQQAAQRSKAKIERQLDATVATVIEPLAVGEFYPAEDYHQNYYQENPVRYKFYRASCGRDDRLAQLWDRAAK